MNILVIGGAGFLGANLVRRCIQDPGNHVTVLDCLEPRLRATTDNLREVWTQIRFVRGSMADEHLIAEMVQGQDVVFNCAAQTFTLKQTAKHTIRTIPAKQPGIHLRFLLSQAFALPFDRVPSAKCS